MKILQLGTIGAVAIFLASVGAVAAKEYTVAVVQSATGPAAFVGAPIRDGALVAVDDINARQLLGPGNTLKVIFADDATDRAQAITLVNRFANDPQVLAIMGPTGGGVAMAGGMAANDNKIVSYATTNSLAYTQTGPYSFALTQPAEVVVPYIARYAVDKLGAKRCVLVGIIDNEAYVAQTRAFEAFLDSRGMKPASVESVKTSDTDFSAVTTKVAAMKDIDCVWVNTAPAPGGNFIVQLRQAGLSPNIHVLGMNIATPEFMQAGGKALEGVFLTGDWVPGGTDEQSRAFAAAYKKKTGIEADNFAPVGYSGMMVLAAAIKAAGPEPTRDGVRDAMAKTRDFPVIVGDGKLTFEENRTARYGLAILTVKDGKFVPAPR